MFRKLLRLFEDILRVLSYNLSSLFPRNKNIWCFGSSFGFTNNAKYLFLYLLDHPLDRIKPIWISDRKECRKLREKGLPCFSRWSLKGLYTTLRSGTYIYDSYVSNINIYTAGNTFKVNLWHGVGIKNIERKISTGPLKNIFESRNPFIKLRYLPLFIKPNIFLTTSPLMTDHFSVCFGINKENCVENSYPRNSIFKMNKNELMRHLTKYESNEIIELYKLIREYDKVYLYMPTWRDSGKDFLDSLSLNFCDVNQIMKNTNSLFLFKPHPATHLSQSFINLSNVKVVENKIDIYPLMPYIDSFITDYSSVYYDWILLRGKEFVFYIPDLIEYKSKERDLAYPYDENTIGIKLKSYTELLSYLNGKLSIKFDNLEIEKLAKRFWGKSYENEYTVETLFNKILNNQHN